MLNCHSQTLSGSGSVQWNYYIRKLWAVSNEVKSEATLPEAITLLGIYPSQGSCSAEDNCPGRGWFFRGAPKDTL